MKRRTLLTGLAMSPVIALAGSLPAWAGQSRYEELKDLIIRSPHRVTWVTTRDDSIAYDIGADFYREGPGSFFVIDEDRWDIGCWHNGRTYDKKWGGMGEGSSDPDRIMLITGLDRFNEHLPPGEQSFFMGARWIENVSKAPDGNFVLFTKEFPSPSDYIYHLIY